MKKKRLLIAPSALAIALLAVLMVILIRSDRVSLKAQYETYPKGTETVACTFKNRTMRTVTYGESFTLEYLDNGEWVNVSEYGTSPYFLMYAKMLGSLSSSEHSYYVGGYSALEEAGTYRIVTSVTMGEKELKLYCPFNVE